MKDLVLQNCHATQYTSEANGKTKWVVKNNEEKLYELPDHWTEHDVMGAIHFARVFELKAYEQGKNDTLKFKEKEISGLKLNYETIFKNLREENIRLATILNQYLEKESIN